MEILVQFRTVVVLEGDCSPVILQSHTRATTAMSYRAHPLSPVSLVDNGISPLQPVLVRTILFLECTTVIIVFVMRTNTSNLSLSY